MLMLSLVLLQKPNLTQNYASAGNRTRVNCLEGSYAHHYTTNAQVQCKPIKKLRKSQPKAGYNKARSQIIVSCIGS